MWRFIALSLAAALVALAALGGKRRRRPEPRSPFSMEKADGLPHLAPYEKPEGIGPEVPVESIAATEESAEPQSGASDDVSGVVTLDVPLENGTADEETVEPQPRLIPTVAHPAPTPTPIQPRRIAPLKRGGRLRSAVVPTNGAGSEEAQDRPELMCWQSQTQWTIGIQVSEAPDDVQLFQDDQQLNRSSEELPRWPLHTLDSDVRIQVADDIAIVPAPADGVGLFRLASVKSTDGRGARSIRTGYYLIVAPRAWILETTGDVSIPIEPEPCNIPNLQTHFIFAGKGDKTVALRRLDRDVITLESRSTRFSIVGDRMPFTGIGDPPIFYGDAVELCDAAHNPWHEVSSIVFCEERKLKRRRWEVIPTHSSCQRLPDAIIRGNGGWYTVRIYDHRTNLLESFDFQILPGLTKFEVSDFTTLPGEYGYLPVRLRFYHPPSLHFTPLTVDKELLRLTRFTDGTEATVPAREDMDRVQWLANYGGDENLSFTVSLERHWWCAAETLRAPPWSDRPFQAQRDQFTATSDLTVFLKSQPSSSGQAVKVGFQEFRARQFRYAPSGIASVPLRDFGDSTELAESLALDLWAWLEPGTPTVIARVPARVEPQPATSPASVKAPQREPLVTKLPEFAPLPPEQFRHLERMSAQQLEEFEREWLAGRVISSQSVPPQHMQEIFRPLAYGKLRHFHTGELSENMAFVFSYAGDRTEPRVKVAGQWPSFAVCRVMHKDDWSILQHRLAEQATYVE